MAEPAPALSAEMSALLSRLQSMGHGYYSESEWRGIFEQIDRLAARANSAQDWDAVLEAALIKAMVYCDMLREYGRSLEVLEEARGKLAAHQPRRMPALYAREAEVYARIGDEDAITRLIAAFKASPYYDAEHYAFTGGQGREVPLAVTRPVARGSDSLTVTTMEMYRQRARFAPGRPFPDFAAVDLRGHPVKLADLRGKVVLLDFWLRGWEAWRRNLPVLQAAYDDYAPRNFEIIGFNLERQADDLPDFLRQNKIRWPVVAGNTDLPRRLGIFGEATNFLLDRNGEIIARDLSGADLTAAIRDALGVP